MATMHRIEKQPNVNNGPKTTGTVLHSGSSYDHFSGLLGTGINGRNSKMIIEMAQIQPGNMVLDIGCGTGSLSLTAKHYTGPSGSVFGIDASPEMIATAREKAQRMGYEAVFEVGLIEQLPYPEASFDVVINRLVMHHLPDDLKRQGVAEILRVLKPGGLLFIADFQPSTNPVLSHIILALVGHPMMQSNIKALPPILNEAGFVDVASGPTKSAVLAFVRGKKPILRP